MNIYQFNDLAKHPFAGVRVGSLAQINQQGVSAVIGGGLSQEARDYANSIDVNALPSVSRRKDASAVHIDLETAIVEKSGIAGAVGDLLNPELPEQAGKSALICDLTDIFSEMSDAFRDRPRPNGENYSGKIVILFVAKVPNIAHYRLHRDANVDLQGFITICGQGSIAADSRVRSTIDLPHSNPLREKTDDRNNDIYGIPTPAFAHVLKQFPSQRAALWLGSLNPNPLIHGEPDVLKPEQSRMIAIVRPYEDSGYYRPKM